MAEIHLKFSRFPALSPRSLWRPQQGPWCSTGAAPAQLKLLYIMQILFTHMESLNVIIKVQSVLGSFLGASWAFLRSSQSFLGAGQAI